MRLAARTIRLAMALSVLLFFAGCAGVFGRPSEPPRVSLADVGIDEIGLLEQKLRLDLRVHNPNDVPIGIDGLSFDLEVNGQRLAQGTSDQRVRIPRYGEARLQVSAVTGLSGLLRQLAELPRAGRKGVDYRLYGRVNIEGWGAIPFSQQGQVALPSLFGDEPPARREGI